MMESPAAACPVPTDQQPINEYQALKDSLFFSWVSLDLRAYVTNLTWVWGWSWLLTGPLAAASFTPKKYILQFILCGAAGAEVFVALLILRLYLGWSYIRDRLLQETIVYEESGWYDGQIWTKPPEVLTRDRLIVSYQVQPILQRLKRTFLILFLFIFGGSLIWNFL